MGGVRLKKNENKHKDAKANWSRKIRQARLAKSNDIVTCSTEIDVRAPLGLSTMLAKTAG